ncbi:MAG: succinate dehydrogenase assembly factor 2 [Hydrogenophilales bacterium 16-64-46]|nr:MAG: succinate dehydrogenase assembly factor 2 [Hydrogenophilales bacterium 12-64-13]OYZ03958.1 MAG: succinate dehydrogenase assembly factor 2 [Hydrogenophilales bacterium 16-64-46]OZA36699.1 MAG: succinate dehydrogenase assembly factor 2 [Hydrogenophilales bacterium 17-64-34]
MGDRIAWRCRRGLLELDLLLGGFWAARRATLQPHETAAFERLLSLSDREIADCLQAGAPQGDPELETLFDCLRRFEAQHIQDPP